MKRNCGDCRQPVEPTYRKQSADSANIGWLVCLLKRPPAALASLLVLSTLLTYAMIIPQRPAQTDPSETIPADLTVAAAMPTARPLDDLSFDEILAIMNRGNLPTPVQTSQEDELPLIPDPEPTDAPIVYDSSGVPQEPVLINAFTEDYALYYVKGNRTNIREMPFTDQPIIGTLEMGDTLTCVGHGLYWSKIETAEGLSGFVLTSLITTDVVAKPTPTPIPTPTPSPTPSPTPTSAPTQTPEPPPTTTTTTSSQNNGGSPLTEEQKAEIVALAKSCLDIPYVYGGTTTSGFDCSGFTQYIYRTLFGIVLPRVSSAQATAGVGVPISKIEIGDIICYDWSGNDGITDHVALYVGDGMFIDASYSARKVRIRPFNPSSPILTIRRIIN